MKTIKIGGVPEHFNLAWYLTLKSGEYKKQGINLRWKDYYGGTGAMCKALREKEIDLAVILTEGIITDIIAGNESVVIQTFVKSPLIWGIHVAKDSTYRSIDELKGKKAAISRFGSGSHLMAYLNAENNNWSLEKDLKFEVVKNLEGAVEALTNKTADYFLWEKFTTKPLVDSNIFRRIGDYPSPWPCFVIASRKELLEEYEEETRDILNIINRTTIEFKDIPNIDKTIANRYDQKLEDVQQWLEITEWSQDLIDEQVVTSVQDKLQALDIIPRKIDYKNLTKEI